MESIDVKEMMDAGQFAQFLRHCADALDLGQPVEMTLHGRTFTLHPESRFKVKFEADKGKEELEMEITWKAA